MERCDQGIATMILVVNLFNRNANTSRSTRLRKKRNALLGGMSLLLGRYNFWQTMELSSRVGQNEQSLKHVIYAVRHLSTVTANINSNLGRLK